MSFFSAVLKHITAAMSTIDIASWFGVSGLFEAASLGITLVGVGLGAGSVMFGIASLIGGYGILQGFRGIGNAAEKGGQALELISNDFTRITDLITDVIWPEIDNVIQTFHLLLHDIRSMVYVAIIVSCLICSLLCFYMKHLIQSKRDQESWLIQKLFGTLTKVLKKLFGRNDQDTNNQIERWILTVVPYIPLFIALVFLILLIHQNPIPFLFTSVLLCTVLIVYYLRHLIYMFVQKFLWLPNGSKFTSKRSRLLFYFLLIFFLYSTFILLQNFGQNSFTLLICYLVLHFANMLTNYFVL